jgi:hypothetical protein
MEEEKTDSQRGVEQEGTLRCIFAIEQLNFKSIKFKVFFVNIYLKYEI